MHSLTHLRQISLKEGVVIGANFLKKGLVHGGKFLEGECGQLGGGGFLKEGVVNRGKFLKGGGVCRGSREMRGTYFPGGAY